MREDLKSGALDGGTILCFPFTFGFRAGNLYGLEKLWALLTYFKGPFPTTVSADLQQEIAKHTADFKVRVALALLLRFAHIRSLAEKGQGMTNTAFRQKYVCCEICSVSFCLIFIVTRNFRCGELRRKTKFHANLSLSAAQTHRPPIAPARVRARISSVLPCAAAKNSGLRSVSMPSLMRAPNCSRSSHMATAFGLFSRAASMIAVKPSASWSWMSAPGASCEIDLCST